MDQSRMNNKKNKNDRFDQRSNDDDEDIHNVDIKTKKKYMEAPVEILREFNMSGNEKKFEQIISDLKFLAKVKPHQKINVSTKQIVSSEDLLDRAYRTYLQVEGKQITLKFVREVITASVDQMFFFSNLKHPFYHSLSEIIKEHISNAKNGIESLAKTYSDNDSVSSEMEAIVTSIDAKLNI